MRRPISPSLRTIRRIALCSAVLLSLATRAQAQLPGLCLPPIPGLPLPGLECTPTPLPTVVFNTPTPPGGTPLPGTTVTPAATGTVDGTPTIDPAATPAPGGSVTVVAQADVDAVNGDAVDAGQFRIRNTGGTRITVGEIRIEASDPEMFSSMTLTGDGQAVTIDEPSTENSFFFDPDLEIAPGESIDVTLSATIDQPEGDDDSDATATPETTATASGTVTPGTPTPISTITPSSSISGLTGRGPQDPSSRPPSGPRGIASGSGPTLLALLLSAVALTIWRSGSKRAAFIAAVLGIALYAGCGGDQTSVQTVSGITASNGTGSVTMSGLPASLGSVSRPEPLIFPGAEE